MSPSVSSPHTSSFESSLHCIHILYKKKVWPIFILFWAHTGISGINDIRTSLVFVEFIPEDLQFFPKALETGSDQCWCSWLRSAPSGACTFRGPNMDLCHGVRFASYSSPFLATLFNQLHAIARDIAVPSVSHLSFSCHDILMPFGCFLQLTSLLWSTGGVGLWGMRQGQ